MTRGPLLVAAIAVLASVVMSSLAPGLAPDYVTPDAPAPDETVTPAPVPTPTPTAPPTPTAVPTPTPDPQEIVGGYQRSTLTEAGD